MVTDTDMEGDLLNVEMVTGPHRTIIRAKNKAVVFVAPSCGPTALGLLCN